MLSSRFRWLLPLFVTSVLCTGCIKSLAPPSFTSEPAIVFNPNPQAPLAAIVRFSTNKPVTTAIRIKDGEWERELIYDESYNPEEGLPIIGMVPDRTHELRVFIHDDFGRLSEAAEPLAFYSLSLPQDRTQFPSIEKKVHVADDVEAGIVLLNVRRKEDNPALDVSYGLLIALNGKGKVVWYYRTDEQISDFTRLDNGNIVYITEDNRAVEIDWLGNTQSEGPSVRELSHAQPGEIISEIMLRDTSAINPIGWTVLGVKHIPYIIPCNYCYAYPGPKRPSRRPF